MADDETQPLVGKLEEGVACQDDIQVQGLKTTKDEGTTWYASVFMVINAALGAGLLDFPYSFSQSGGIATSLSVQAVLLCFIVGSLLLLAYSSEFKKTSTFPSTVKTLCGRSVEVVSSVCIILYTFGTCITFLIIISDQLGQFFTFVTGGHVWCQHWYMNKDFTLTVSAIVFILPMCLSKRIDFLKYASFAGVIAVLYVVFLIIARYAVTDTSHVQISTKPDSIMDVFMVIPTVCFSYQCHVSAIPIYSCMRNRNLRDFSKTVSCAILVCIFAYSVSASLGYYTFGNSVNQDILESYQPPTADVVVGVFMIAAKTYTTFPILAFCGRVELEKLWVYAWKLDEVSASRYEFKRRCVLALIWFSSSLVIALYVPNIAQVINVLGGLAAMFIFFFPGMCLLRIAFDYIPESKTMKRRLLILVAGVFMVIGIFLFGLVTTQSIMKDIDTHSSSTIPASPC